MSRYDELVNWYNEVQLELATSITTRDALHERIDYLTKLVEHIGSVIQLTKSEPNIRLPLPNVFNNHQLSNNADAVDDKGRKRTFVTKRWLDYCEEYLFTHKSATVDELFVHSPLEIQDDLEKSGPHDSVLFRARRMLRRDARFVVDRNTGVVTLEKGAASKPLPPPPPPPQPIVLGPVPSVQPTGGESCLVLSGAREIEKGKYEFIGYVPAQPGVPVVLTFPEIVQRIQTLNDVWVKDGGSFEPVGVRTDSDGLTRVGSFTGNNWTATLRNIVQASFEK